MVVTTQEETVASIPAVPVGPGGRNALVGRRIFPSPLGRRIVYAVVFEILAVGFTTIFFALFGNLFSAFFFFCVYSFMVALAWNFLFHRLFEAFERRIKVTHRPWYMRVSHAVLFEGG